MQRHHGQKIKDSIIATDEQMNHEPELLLSLHTQDQSTQEVGTYRRVTDDFDFDRLSLRVSSIQASNITHYVKGGETLMSIALHAYSDYHRWREIYEWNRHQIADDFSLSPGMRLVLKKPLKPYQRPEGLPYFIKRGDSLSRIAGRVYGDMNLWPKIRENNPVQIKNPNLIFAGFTLFYPKTESQSSDFFALRD